MTDSMGGLNQIGYQQLSVSNTSVALTLPTAANATRPKHAIIKNESSTTSVRWRADGTDPTDSVGMLVGPGEVLNWMDPVLDYFGILKRIEFIRATNDTTLSIAYFD